MHIFGKDNADLYWFHEDLLKNESELLELQKQVESQYLIAPMRRLCVLCGEQLKGGESFKRNSILFVFCEACGHVNGDHEVAPDFVNSMYTSSVSDSPQSSLYGKEFTTGKMAGDYWDVVDRIYSPKAQFLAEFLNSRSIAIEETSVLDVGCGSGHFVNALLKNGFTSARGFDSFALAIEAAQRIGNLNAEQAFVEDPNNLLTVLAQSEASIISMMCVLVHLDSPTEALKAMSKNPNTKFTYQKIPMWSFATMLEAAFPGFRARVLGSDHSNIFSHESLLWIEEELGMTRVASWTFGGDWLDLQRRVLIGMERSGSSAPLVSRVNTSLGSVANDVQQLIDRTYMSSEIHLIWEFN